jgi:hypothetical protein
VRGEGQFQRLGQVLQQVEAVRHLHGPGCAVARALGIGAGAVAGEHCNAGVLAQPGRERACLAVGQQRHRTVLFQVDQHGAVDVPFAQRPVVHAQGGGRRHGRQGCPPDQAQQRVAARRQPELVAKTRARGTAQR